jgi:hypothetical protein
LFAASVGGKSPTSLITTECQMENNFVWKSFLMKTGYQSAIRCHSDGSLSECGGVTRHYWADSAQVFSLAAQFCTKLRSQEDISMIHYELWLAVPLVDGISKIYFLPNPC